MKKLLTIIFFISVCILNLAWTKKPPKCNCPIYFFEETNKEKIFDALDTFLQSEKIIPLKYYPELTFISIDYKIKSKEKEIVTFDIKQFGNDAYLFIDASKSNSNLEAKLYHELKKHSKNSYLLRDDLFCKEFKKDINSINRNKKIYLTERKYNPAVYTFDMHRYVGYDKKNYFRKKKIKDKNKEKI